MRGHESIRKLIEDTAKSLADNIQFMYAKETDFNQLREQQYPFVVLDPLVAIPGYSVNNSFNYSKTWLVQMAFYQLDYEASTGDEYAKILDVTDTLVDNFINKLNFYQSHAEINGDIILSSFRQEPFIKATSNILTGYILTFNLLVPDNFEYCEIEC